MEFLRCMSDSALVLSWVVRVTAQSSFICNIDVRDIMVASETSKYYI